MKTHFACTSYHLQLLQAMLLRTKLLHRYFLPEDEITALATEEDVLRKFSVSS